VELLTESDRHRNDSLVGDVDGLARHRDRFQPELLERARYDALACSFSGSRDRIRFVSRPWRFALAFSRGQRDRGASKRGVIRHRLNRCASVIGLRLAGSSPGLAPLRSSITASHSALPRENLLWPVGDGTVRFGERMGYRRRIPSMFQCEPGELPAPRIDQWRKAITISAVQQERAGVATGRR
jgi:hypothetical protein